MGKPNVSFSGGDKLNQFFKNAGEGGVRGFDVGFFAGATYPDGTPIASVAAWNEFGTVHNPERPAIRFANKKNQPVLLRIIEKNVDPKVMVIDVQLAGLLGANHQAAIQQSMIAWKDPPNAPSTLKAKAPRTNPLVWTGTMVRSVTFKVVK